ncbi:MAG TPA: hypothetical protein VM674_08810 [Candidatus Acidoferrum sp.]|nr:hypothetical protein [Candidatus Acidoferrum sp.]
MGYWGHVLIARRRRSLTELPDVRPFGRPQEHQDLVGEWKLLRIAGDYPPDLQQALAPVVRATAAPALVASVLDSDCAIVQGQTPAGVRWGAVLNRELAAGYDGILESYDTPDHGLSGVLRWAREAGLTPRDHEIKDALNAKATFVEDVIDQLLLTLGILKRPN